VNWQSSMAFGLIHLSRDFQTAKCGEIYGFVKRYHEPVAAKRNAKELSIRCVSGPRNQLSMIWNGSEDAPSEPLFSSPTDSRFPRISFCQTKGLEIVTLPICCPS
jgi:hypothetical protein